LIHNSFENPQGGPPYPGHPVYVSCIEISEKVRSHVYNLLFNLV